MKYFFSVSNPDRFFLRFPRCQPLMYKNFKENSPVEAHCILCLENPSKGFPIGVKGHWIFLRRFFFLRVKTTTSVAFIGIATNKTTSAMRQRLEHIRHAVWQKLNNPNGAGTLERFVQKGSKVENRHPWPACSRVCCHWWATGVFSWRSQSFLCFFLAFEVSSGEEKNIQSAWFSGVCAGCCGGSGNTGHLRANGTNYWLAFAHIFFCVFLRVCN